MNDSQQVLVVDGLVETRDVLDAVFAPRGIRVDRVESRSPRPPRSTAAHPQVVVLHEGVVDGEAGGNATHHVLVGRAAFPESAPADDVTRIAQPFHYAELVRAVERCLGEAGPSG